MSTLAEIQAAMAALPPGQKQQLFAALARQLGKTAHVSKRAARRLKAAARPPLEGLPADLSVGTRTRVRTLVASRHGAHR